VVMSLDLLGEGFDIHGGGLDLAFPHHENERAQAVAAGRAFARHWVHNGFVEVGGEKMSKSLGNFTNLLDLVESTDPRAYRLLVLRAHYRTPLEISKATTDDASAALKKFDTLARAWAEADLPAAPADPEALERFRAAMDDDLDTPRVIALLSDLRRRTNTALSAEDHDEAASLGAAFTEICGALGLVLDAGGGEVSADALDLARRRDEARAAKDWVAADALRDELVAAGWVVEDTPQGTQIRRA
jgi:cysteinyl-tRNA synthetase